MTETENVENVEPTLPIEEKVDWDLEIVEVWNKKYPDTNDTITKLELRDLINKEEHTPEEFILIQTLLHSKYDAGQLEATSILITFVAEALLQKLGRFAAKGPSGKRANAIKEEADNYGLVIEALFNGFRNLTIDPLGSLGAIKESGISIQDLVNTLIQSEKETLENVTTNQEPPAESK